MPDSYYSGVGYPYPVEERCPGGKYYVPPSNNGYTGSVAGSTASSATIRPTYVNSQNQLGIDYPASQISRASSAARSNAGSYHSLRDVDPSDSVSVVGGSVVSSASRASHASHASRASNLSHVSRASNATVRPEDSLSQVGAGSTTNNNNNRGRAHDLSARELALLHAQGGHHAPTIVSGYSSRAPSLVGSQAGGSQAGGSGQMVPYGAGSDISTDSTLVIDMRNEVARQGGGGNSNGDLNIVVTEADIARGRDMWPGLDRESIKCRMKVVLTREEVTRRMAARSRR